MGGETAAGVLSVVRRDAMTARGEPWSDDDEAAYRETIRQQYEAQGHPYYATARLWDDGVIDPVDTRWMLGMAIAASLNAPIAETRYGVFRM
jgi:3-methylcrotonyl-CoA carboxylase beta subunit